MRRALPLLLLVAAAGVLAVLFFALRPEGEAPASEPAPRNEITTVEAGPVEYETLRVTIRDGRPVGGIQRLAVDAGQHVRVVVEADVRDEVHVHGYDVTGEVTPDGTSALGFQATIPGRFEIELEERHLLIAELEVRP